MYKYLLTISILIFVSCAKTDKEQFVENIESTKKDSLFNRAKWDIKQDGAYVYRKEMMEDIVYNDTIRDLNREQIIDLLGEPDRVKNNYIYYLISEKKLVFWPLHTTMIVFRFNEQDEIVWLKIHK